MTIIYYPENNVMIIN